MIFGFLRSCCRGPDLNGNVDAELAPTFGDLSSSAAAGHVKTVELLLKGGADVNASTLDPPPGCLGATPLILASCAGHEAVVRRLLDVPDIEVNAVSTDAENKVRSNQSALHWAARLGKTAVAQALLKDTRTDVEAKTAGSFTALQIASQAGQVAIMRALIERGADPAYSHRVVNRLDMSCMRCAMMENHPEAIEVLLQTGRIDVNKPYGDLLGPKSTYLHMAVAHHFNDVVRTLLQYKADVNTKDDDGKPGLLLAASNSNLELTLTFLQYGADTEGVFSSVRYAQLTGDAFRLRRLLKERKETPDDNLPMLHRAAVEGNIRSLEEAMTRLGSANAISHLEDGGYLPGAYYAVELRHKDTIDKLLHKGHKLSPHVLSIINKFMSSAAATEATEVEGEGLLTPGTLTFAAAQGILAESAGVCEDHDMAKGAFAFLKPWCGSLSALNYFLQNPGDFDLLRMFCKDRCNGIYERIDSEVTAEVLVKLGEIGMDENRERVRQDADGLVPEFKYFMNGDNGGSSRGGNNELFVCRSLALLASSLDKLFHADMKALFADTGMEVQPAPSKTFTRMFNKLNNPEEHGDPTLKKPRPLHNIDVIRFGVVCESPEDLRRALAIVKSKHKILRVKNNHNPHTDGGFGGYRSILVNFAFDSRVTYGDVFGTTGYVDAESKENNVIFSKDENGQAWLDYAKTLGRHAGEWSWALVPLWRIARLQPERHINLAAEVQIIYRPYSRGRVLSHLLYKISRCETGPAEMARDFAPEEFFAPTGEQMTKRARATELAHLMRQRKESKERKEESKRNSSDGNLTANGSQKGGSRRSLRLPWRQKGAA